MTTTPSLERHDRFERRRRTAPGVAAGVTEEMIGQLVGHFYDQVRRDPELGPIFNAKIIDWPEHLEKLCDFWSSVTLMTGRFKGTPMQAHARLAEVHAAHFRRWLALWRSACQVICPPPAAALFIAKAEMIGESLQLGTAAARGASHLQEL